MPAQSSPAQSSPVPSSLAQSMRLTDFLDKGASLGAAAPCLTMDGRSRSYAEVQQLSWVIGQALARSGIRPGDKVAVLSANDPVAFSCVFGIARAGAVWCPVNPATRRRRTAPSWTSSTAPA